MSKEEIFKMINDWQMYAGEDFLDYFDSDVTETSFMFWCLGKGYINQDRFHSWEKAYDKTSFGHSLTEFLYSYDNDDNGFSIVHSEDWEQNKQDEAYFILSEFISNSRTYQRRLLEFLADN